MNFDSRNFFSRRFQNRDLINSDDVASIVFQHRDLIFRFSFSLLLKRRPKFRCKGRGKGKRFTQGSSKSRPIVLSGFNYANEMAHRRITGTPKIHLDPEDDVSQDIRDPTFF